MNADELDALAKRDSFLLFNLKPIEVAQILVNNGVLTLENIRFVVC